jgi:hypothetical protein
VALIVVPRTRFTQVEQEEAVADKIKDMSKECKQARNVFVLTAIVLATIIIILINL